MLWQPDWDARLKNPEQTRLLLDSLDSDPATTYDLLFYAAFADKLIPVMQKAGPQSDGFDRMQQSLAEAVQKVRSAVVRAGNFGFRDAPRFTDLSSSAMASLMELIHDLAIVKQSSKV